MTLSERLFEEFCETNGLLWARIPVVAHRTPDYRLALRGTPVTCEVKQINPNRADLEELDALRQSRASGRWVPNRVRGILKNISPQLRSACIGGEPTLLVIYDNTAFKTYTMHADIVQAMFGQSSVRVTFQSATEDPIVSAPYFGGQRGITPAHNTTVSAIAILDGGPVSRPLSLRVYHNPYARVRLEPSLFDSPSVTHVIRPDATCVSLELDGTENG